MNLPTPPSTCQKEKENRVPFSGTRVIWSPENQYRTITPLPHVPPSARAVKSLPTKSILKQRSQPLLPLVDAFQRETTPEPSQPRFDPTYLASHVAAIIDTEASLDALIRAYSVLAARIRAHVTLTTDSDGSWPILEPLHKNRIAFHLAIVRDLGRCLVDPETMVQTPEDIEEEAYIRSNEPAAAMLPSPKSTPKKKKKGTTAKKAKYGRDLCTTCHSVLKFLGVVFTLPAVSAVFTTSQLGLLLTHVLAIPLADDLPTPNARKTYALAIWLLQSQRLSPTVLEPAADRIVFALRRGIEGELGKEGKKGSASDGLKAIHDLSVYRASIFVPKFESLLPSVLANLLAPTVAIRALACHALGGFARGLTTLPVSALHARISAVIAAHLTDVSSSPARKSSSPTKASNETPLVRTIRTTLQATEVPHVSQGPVWGLSVLAALLVLANSAVYAHDKARRVFVALLSQAMTHKKSSVRSLGCAIWRCAIWAYCQPLLPVNGDDDESEVEEEDEARSKQQAIQNGREIFWSKIIVTVVDMGVGLSTVAALLQETEANIEDCITRISTVLKAMSSKGGVNLTCAIETLAMMLSFGRPEGEWNWNKLLPRGLLTASPGLLTAEFNALETPVRAIITQCPEIDDVRSLTRDEVSQPAVFEKLVEVWKECVGALGLQDNATVPTKVVSIWGNLIQAQVSMYKDGEAPDSDIREFAIQAIDILIDILLDSNIDVTLKHGEVRYCTDGLEPTNHLSNAALKLKIVHELWIRTRSVIAGAQLGSAAEKLIFILMKSHDEFTDSGDVSIADWATLCADVLVICDPEDVMEFWKYDGAANSKWEWTNDVRSLVWRCFVEKWKAYNDCAWQGVVTLLAVPFMANKAWNFSDSDNALWEAFLGHGIDRALDYGLDAVSVLDHVAAAIAKEHSPTSTATCLVADALLTHLPMQDARELPEALFEFINDALRSNYPPEPRNKQQALWTLRSVGRAIDLCPDELVVDLIRVIESGLYTWISDEHEALSETEYTYDVVTLYQNILMKIGTLPPAVDVLEAFGSVLEAGFTWRVGAAIVDGFTEFWQDTYGKEPAPPGGWPAEVQTCLNIAFAEPTLIAPWDQLSLSPPFRGQQVLDAHGKEAPIGSPFKFSSARFRSVSPEPADQTGVSAVRLSRPVTPIARSGPSTPPTPHKVPSVASPTSPSSPSCAPYHPSTPSTSKRTPLRLVSGSDGRPSPSKRRKLFDNKENESPGMQIASVMERISASPKSGRNHASPGYGEERPLKRTKQDPPTLGGANQGDIDEERFVELALVERDDARVGPAAPVEGDVTPSKKRKRYRFDGVEVSSVHAVYSSPKDVLPHVSVVAPSAESWLETRSTSQAMRRLSAPGELATSSRKRRRDSDGDEVSEDPFMSGYSVSKKAASSQVPSSDDDEAYFGQVTPFHVFSPIPRRARDDDPPSSDDSIMSASPLKGKVVRPVQKTGSAGRLVLL